jgi:succinate dehydrogenase/fumarate reductase-like Fe-S protein
MKITIVREKPVGPAEARRDTFELPDFGPTSISSALQYIARNMDSSIGYYLSCRRGLCACCVVRANGKIETACVVPVSDGMVVEPIRLDLLVADTVVDLSMARDARFEFGDLPVGGAAVRPVKQ